MSHIYLQLVSLILGLFTFSSCQDISALFMKQTANYDCVAYGIVHHTKVDNLAHCAWYFSQFRFDLFVSPNVSYFKGSCNSPPHCYVHNITKLPNIQLPELKLDATICYTQKEGLSGAPNEIRITDVLEGIPTQANTYKSDIFKYGPQFSVDRTPDMCAWLVGTQNVQTDSPIWRARLDHSYMVTQVNILRQAGVESADYTFQIRVQNEMYITSGVQYCTNTSRDDLGPDNSLQWRYTYMCGPGLYVVIQAYRRNKETEPDAIVNLVLCEVEIYGIRVNN